MVFHIRNRQTDALARKVATAKGVGLAQAVHEALLNELERAAGEPSLFEKSVKFSRLLHEKGRPDLARPADREFIDSLYEND